MDLPKTEHMRPRPVWARSQKRALRNFEAMPPPTEEEKYDAIRVLEDPYNAVVPELWAEAHRIFDEASE